MSKNAKYRGTYAQFFFLGGGGVGEGLTRGSWSKVLFSYFFFNCPLSNPYIMSIVDGAYHDGLHISTQNCT